MFKPSLSLGSKTFALLPLAGLGIAVGLSFMAPGLAQADDITVNASVIESTPTATPANFVRLPIGDTASSSPTVDIQITGLEPYSFVQVFAQSDPILIASGFADKYGVFKVKAPLPPSLEVGDHAITASVQQKGETTAVIQTLAKFAVAAGGKVAAAPKNGGKGSNSGGTSGGSNASGGQDSGGSGTVTQSPVPTPLPTQGSNSIGGVLLVGGALAESKPSWNLDGDSARVAVSVQNNYESAYPIKASVSISNLLGWQVASISDVNVGDIQPGQHQMIIATTKSGIGQWGFYSATVRVIPPSSVDGIALNPLNREVSFFVLPLWPSALILLYVIYEIARKFYAPRLLRMRLAKLQAELELDERAQQ